MMQEGLLFKDSKLCIPRCSMRENSIQEKHSGGLSIHFGQDKTFALVSNFYFCPKMQHDVKKFVERCRVCQHAKGRSQNIILYQPLAILARPWDSISVDFFGHFLRNLQKKLGTNVSFSSIDHPHTDG